MLSIFAVLSFYKKKVLMVVKYDLLPHFLQPIVLQTWWLSCVNGVSSNDSHFPVSFISQQKYANFFPLTMLFLRAKNLKT